MSVATRIAIQRNAILGFCFDKRSFTWLKSREPVRFADQVAIDCSAHVPQGPETLLVSPHNALLVPCIGAADYRLDCGMRPNRGSRSWIRLHTSSASLSKSTPSLGIRSQWLILFPSI